MHLCPEMNASIVSEYFMSYWALRNFLGIILCVLVEFLRTLCDAYYEEGEFH